MIVIILNGSAQTGKDKFVYIFKEITNFRVKNLSSIDKVKAIAELCFNWDGRKTEKSRKFLSDLKKAWIDFNNGPFNEIISKIEIDLKYCKKNNKDTDNNVYFIHVREPEEINKFKEKYGKDCVTILLKKDVGFIPNNYSDMNVENYEYDYIVDNNKTIHDLKISAKKISDELFLMKNPDIRIFHEEIEKN